MQKKHRKLQHLSMIRFWLTIFILLCASSTVSAQPTPTALEQLAKTKAYYEENVDTPDDWSSLHRSFIDSAPDVEYIKNHQSREEPWPTKPTSVARIVTGLSAAGEDASAPAYDGLVDHLVGFDQSYYTAGVNELAWTLIALDSGSYTPETGIDRGWLIDALLEQQTEDGLWPGFQPDMSTVVMTALAPYNTEAYPEVQRALAKAASAFEGSIPDNSNSVAQLIIALSANGIDPAGSDYTASEGTTLIDALLSYALEDGTFFWNHEYQDSNALATKDAFHALMAYDAYVNTGSGLIYNDLLEQRTDASATKPTEEGETRNEDRQSGLPVTVSVALPGNEWLSMDVNASTPIDGFEQLLTKQSVSYQIEDTAFGPYLSAVDGLEAGTYDSNAGWQFTITRDGKTFIPNVGAGSTDVLHEGDVVQFYYGGFGVQPVSDYSFAMIEENTLAIALEKMIVTYDQQGIARETTSPAAQVDVQLNGQTEKTNEHGIAVFSNVEADLFTGRAQSGAESDLPQIAPTPLSFTAEPFSDTSPAFPDALWIEPYAFESVTTAVEHGWMDTVAETEAFLPDKSVTRAEAVQLFINVMDVDVQTTEVTEPFTDVESRTPSYSAVAAAYQKGWIQGNNEGQFLPKQAISRQELALIIDRMLSIPEYEDANSYIDEDRIWTNARDAVYSLTAAGLLKGDGNAFHPHEDVSRESAAVIVDRIDKWMHATP
ncbi:S-layer homology domain-containing protein [Litoribacterium kuwaitense]|uniref:S-layer homology domain-containing protein n=1 Tax=Litoribacterium kuwaitense TaxID=1398745 RepID=UPI001FE2FBC3|nr:S-layer homology domain-containing protein [Litoribacterium kuwaitense]